MYSFGKRLRYLRVKEGLRQEDLANKLGISKSAVGMYERDEREPSLELIQRISSFFGVSADYLIGQTDEPTNKKEKVDHLLHRISNLIDPDLDPKYAEAFLNTLEKIFHRAQQPDFPKKQEEALKIILEIFRGMMVEGKSIPDPILEILLVSLQTAKNEMLVEKEKNNKPPQSSEG